MAVVRSVTVLSSGRDEAEDLLIVRYPPIAGIDDQGRDREVECRVGRHGALVVSPRRTRRPPAAPRRARRAPAVPPPSGHAGSSPPAPGRSPRRATTSRCGT